MSVGDMSPQVGRRLDGWLFEPAPPQRLAAMRILVGIFTVVYFTVRTPVIWNLRNRPASDFGGVGPLAWLDRPLPDPVFGALLISIIVLALAFTFGVGFRVVGPSLAVAVLTVTTYRSSWGQLLHFENLLSLHLIIVGLAPSAEAWSVDARTGAATANGRPSVRYGWPLRLAAITTAVTYFLAGVAKLRIGGTEWMVGDTLRNHLAYSATRLDVLGESASPLAGPTIDRPALLPVLAVGVVVIELVAPVALFVPAFRVPWVAATWLMHAGIAALMFVVFPYPLFLVAFAPLFTLERLRSGRDRSSEDPPSRDEPRRL